MPAGEALLRPVRPGNAFEETVERLLSTIRLGVLRPGECLPPERELAVRVSRGDTLRDALRFGCRRPVAWWPRRGRYGGTFWPSGCPPTGEGVGATRAEIDDLLRLREILGGRRGEDGSGRTLTVAAERDATWGAGRRGCGASPRTIGGWDLAAPGDRGGSGFTVAGAAGGWRTDADQRAVGSTVAAATSPTPDNSNEAIVQA